MIDNEMLNAMRDLLRPINLKLEKMDNRMDNIECEMKKGLADMNGRMANMEGYMANMNSRIAKIEGRMANMEKDISNLRLEVKQGFRKKDDEIETLVTVLEGKNIMPIANHQQKSMIQQKGEQTL